MYTTTTSSKSAVRFTIDFFNKTITGTKASFDKAGKGFGAEYEELTAKPTPSSRWSSRSRSPKSPEPREAMREWTTISWKTTLDCRSGLADPMSEAFLQMAGVFSQLELAMIRERVRSGMANAKAKGKQIGRPQITRDNIPAIFLRHYPAYKNGQLNTTELSRVCDLSRTTVYKYISLLGA